MDTSNVGSDLLTKQQEVHQQEVLQQQHEEIQSVDKMQSFDTHRAMMQEPLDQFASNQVKSISQFKQTYKHRKQIVKGDEPVVQTEVQTAPVQVENPPAMDEPDAKAMKKKQQQRAKTIEKAKKQGILAASEYSLDMIKQYSDYKKIPPEDIPEQEQKKQFQQFVSEFAIDEKMFLTENVGRNLTGVQSYLDKVAKTIHFYNDEHPELLGAMTATFQQKMANMIESYSVMQTAYNNALMLHGLKLNQGKLDALTADDLSKVQGSETIQQMLLEQEEKNKTNTSNIAEAEIEAYSEQIRKNTKRFDSSYMSDNFYYQEEFDTMVKSHPEQYQKNKQLIDNILEYARKIMEASSSYTPDSLLMANISEMNQVGQLEKEAQSAAKQKQKQARESMGLLKDTLPYVEITLSHLLQGTAMTNESAQFMDQQFGYKDQEYADNIEYIQKNAGMYMTTFKEKTELWKNLLENERNELANNQALSKEELEKENAVLNTLATDTRAFMLMKIEDTDEASAYNQDILRAKIYGVRAQKLKNKGDLGEPEKAELSQALKGQYEIFKDKFKTFYDKVMDFDIENLVDAPPEEIIRRQHELQEIGMENMHFSDCCKVTNPETGVTIKNEVIENDLFKSEFSDKLILIQNYMVMGRTLAMMQSYQDGTLTRDMMNSTELAKINAGENDDEECHDKMAKYAAKTYANAEKLVKTRQKALQATYLNHYVQLRQTEDSYRDTQDDWKDTAWHRLSEEISAVMQSYKAELQQSSEEEYRKVYRQLQDAGKEREADLLEIRYALMFQSYTLSGDDNLTIHEPIFRSLGWAGVTKMMQGVSDDEVFRIAKRLAKGRLSVAENQSPEERAEQIAANRQENMAGVHDLLMAMAPHMNYIEEKYKYQIPSYEYTINHYIDIQHDFAFGQVVNNLAVHIDVLDEKNPQEARLLRQIRYYNNMGMLLVTQASMSAIPDAVTRSMMKETTKKGFEDDPEFLAYLKTHEMQR